MIQMQSMGMSMTDIIGSFGSSQNTMTGGTENGTASFESLMTDALSRDTTSYSFKGSSAKTEASGKDYADDRMSEPAEAGAKTNLVKTDSTDSTRDSEEPAEITETAETAPDTEVADVVFTAEFLMMMSDVTQDAVLSEEVMQTGLQQVQGIASGNISENALTAESIQQPAGTEQSLTANPMDTLENAEGFTEIATEMQSNTGINAEKKSMLQNSVNSENGNAAEETTSDEVPVTNVQGNHSLKQQTDSENEAQTSSFGQNQKTTENFHADVSEPAGQAKDNASAATEIKGKTEIKAETENDVDAALVNPETVGLKETSQSVFSDVGIKVSDGATLEQAVVEQTTDTIVAKISEGVQEFEMVLNPEELGKVMIKLVFSDGKAQIQMKCTEQHAQKALMENADVIRQIIESDTGMETTVRFSQPEDKFDSYEDQRQQEREQEQKQKSGQEESSEDVDAMNFVQQLRLGLMGESVLM